MGVSDLIRYGMGRRERLDRCTEKVVVCWWGLGLGLEGVVGDSIYMGVEGLGGGRGWGKGWYGCDRWVGSVAGLANGGLGKVG